MNGELALVPYSDMEKMANVMSKSGMFGKSPEQMLSLFLIAQAEGLHPAKAAQEYDVIQGRPAIKSQAALARFQEAGGKIEWKERSDTRACAIFTHPQSAPVTVDWDMAKATRMRLADKDNWKKQPGIMLQWRVVAEGVRICYPACLNRMYLVEEVQDFEPLRNVTSSEGAPVKDPSKAPVETEAKPVDEHEAHFDEYRERMKVAMGSGFFTEAEQKAYGKQIADKGGMKKIPAKDYLEIVKSAEAEQEAREALS